MQTNGSTTFDGRRSQGEIGAASLPAFEASPPFGSGMFCAPEPLPEIPRRDLVAHALESEARWIAIDGAPGSGKTTLLGQLANELASRGETFRAIWTARRASAAYDFFVYRRSGDLRALLRWLRSGARESGSGRFTLIVDDYDLLATERYLALLAEICEAVPGMRIVTTTVDPLRLDPRFTGFGEDFLFRIPAARLLLDYEETREFCRIVAESWGADEAAKVAPPGDGEIRRMFEMTRGFPLGVGLAVARLSESPVWSEHALTQLMQTVYAHILRSSQHVRADSGYTHLVTTFSLMPRFTHQHITTCFPDAGPEAVAALLTSPALDPHRALRAGEYAWSEDFWHVAKQWNAARFADRRELATRLYHHNDAGEAFEQWFLAGDLARAEAMLRTRFLTVYETLSPETARGVHSVPPAELVPFPMIRVLQMLLDPQAPVHELRQCTQNLMLLGSKGGAAGLVALSVRAAVLARKGLSEAACAQAEQVLHQAAEFDEGSEDTEAELRSVSEATLTAVLALFACGAIPKDLASLPRSYGSAFLSHRRDLAQQVLERARLSVTREDSVLRSPGPHSYRALIFSGAECVREAAALESYDRMFEAGGELGAERPPAPPRVLGPFADCLDNLLSGNLSGAVETAYRGDIAEPAAGFLRAIVKLASGRYREALNRLAEIDDAWGARARATKTVLWACAQLQAGRAETARAALRSSDRLPETALAQALTFVRAADARTLVDLSPGLAEAGRIAETVGALGSGRLIPEVSEIPSLTAKERMVLEGLRDGLNTRQIAESHFLSVNTVRTHVRSIGKKLGASGHAQMLLRAEELRLLSVPLHIR